MDFSADETLLRFTRNVFLVSEKNPSPADERNPPEAILWRTKRNRQSRGSAKPLVTPTRHSSVRLSPGPTKLGSIQQLPFFFSFFKSANCFVSGGTDSRPGERDRAASDEGEVGVNQDHGWDAVPEVPGSILGTTCEPQKEEEGLEVGGEVGDGCICQQLKRRIVRYARDTRGT